MLCVQILCVQCPSMYLCASECVRAVFHWKNTDLSFYSIWELNDSGNSQHLFGGGKMEKCWKFTSWVQFSSILHRYLRLLTTPICPSPPPLLPNVSRFAERLVLQATFILRLQNSGGKRRNPLFCASRYVCRLALSCFTSTKHRVNNVNFLFIA